LHIFILVLPSSKESLARPC